MKKEFTKDYAIALFDLSIESNKVEQTYEQLKLLINSINENKDFIKILAHPQISKENKKQMIKEVYNSFDINIVNFLYVLIDNDRFVGIFEIHEEFTELFNEYQNIIYVKALTTVALDKVQIDRLKVKLMIKYRHKIEVINVIDPQILGGMRLIINEEVIDFTIKNQISSLKSHVLKQI